MDVASLSPWLPSQAGALSITIRPHGLLMHILVAFSGIGVGVGVEITHTETKVTGSIASPSIKRLLTNFLFQLLRHSPWTSDFSLRLSFLLVKLPS